jgi:hypothetical protein
MKSRVVLLQGHSAKPGQTIKVDGTLYLKDEFSERPAVYDNGEAINKARMFRGVAQPVTSKYDLADTVSIAQIREDNIPKEVLRKITSNLEPAYVDTDNSIGEKVYYTSGIAELIGETSGELNLEFRELYDYVVEYSYVVFLKC